MNYFKIKNFQFSKHNKPYIIAEVSSNHKNKLSAVLKLISKIKKAGADAVKLQTYSEDTMTIDSKREEFKIKKGLWKNYTLYDLYKDAKTPLDWYKKIFAHCKKVGITCFSTPFNESAVDFLEKFKVPAYKVASFEIVDLPLISYIAKLDKPLIISTGMANFKEILEAVNVVKKNKNKKLIILHCLSNYPAKNKDYNLSIISDLKKKFKCHVGLSDHTVGETAAIASVALGASVFEKHIKLDDDNLSQDSSFSMKVSDFKNYCSKIHNTWESIGTVNYEKKKEKDSRKHRRSIYITQDIKKNDKFTLENIKRIRPANGAHPKYFPKIIGKKAAKNLSKETPMKLSFIKNFNS